MTQYKRILQVGAGGVGFWLACSLNRSLPHGVELHVWDADDFNGGLGHSRLPRISNPETKKVSLLRGFCSAVMGDKAPTVHPEMFNGDEAQPGDLVVDCSDMGLPARRTIWALAEKSGARLVRVSYDGLNETVVVAQGLPFAHKGKGGYREAPGLPLSMMAGGVGALAVLRILNGYSEHLEFQISLGDYFRPGGIIDPAILDSGHAFEHQPVVKDVSEYFTEAPILPVEPELTPSASSYEVKAATTT